jgi:hypothetical protein
MNAPRGWTRAGETDGIPLWRWRDEAFYAATRDMDQLLFVGACLIRFDQMNATEFRAYVGPLNGRVHPGVTRMASSRISRRRTRVRTALRWRVGRAWRSRRR